MASHRAIDPNLVPVGDLFEYNGPFPCFPQPPYNRRRNGGVPLDVPFNPEFLDSETSDALHRMLSSTAAPSGGIASGAFMQTATPDQMAEVEDWFLPINGQEDNLTGLGGNWDYVKWNAMVVACFMKQLQLGPNLRKLIRVHPPIQLYCEHDDKQVVKAGIMGKQQFKAFYKRKDVNNPRQIHKTWSGGKPVKITPDTGTTIPPEEPKGDDSSTEPTGTGDPPKDKKKGDGDGDDSGESDSEDSSDEDTPDWLKLHPAPRGTKAVKHPLAGIYGDAPFLPVDSKGNWVPSGAPPKRDLMSLIDPDDPLYNILSKAAQELVKEEKDGKKKTKKSNKSKDKNKAGDTALRVAGKPFAPGNRYGAKRKALSDRTVLHRVKAKFKQPGLRMAGGGTDTVDIDAIEPAPAPPSDDMTKAPVGTKMPWERYHTNVGGKGPDFRRRIWPSLKKDLGRKRWHIMPVACDVNGELRWWLMVIDMQVQRRWNIDADNAGKDGKGKDDTKDGTTDAIKNKTKDGTTDTAKDPPKDGTADPAEDGGPDGTKDGSKTGTTAAGPARCIWVFDPCSTPSVPDGTVFERFLSEVPRYIYSLASRELSKLDHHTVPVVFPRSNDAAGLTNFQDGTLAAHEYDHPARFKHFGFKVTIKGNRFNWRNRNPQTGVEVIHAMGRVLRMMELEDARHGAMWRTMGEDSPYIRCSVPAAAVPTTAPTLRELDLLQESNETISFQNRVRTETIVEIQRFMDWTQLRAYPFHEDTPNTIPEEGYRMLRTLHKSHAEVWQQISKWFDQGSHAAVVGMKLEDDSTTNNIVSFPLALGTMAVLHGKKGRHPGDDPQTDWWAPGPTSDGDTTGVDLLAMIPDNDPGKINPGHKYHRFANLKEDCTGGGSMPVSGGPRKPTDILENQYPQSMISVIIDSIGRGIIHVGNRPNGVWKVNGVAVQQSEVITRFSHVTHLYGSSMHWLFLRRFATSRSENIRMQTTVKHDILNLVRVPKRSEAENLEENSPDDPIWLYPRHTFPNEKYKKYNFDLGRDTPHLHHHHRPKKISSREEYVLWESYNNSVNTILCQNPACMQHSHHAGDKAVEVPNGTARPCFDLSCVAGKYETYYYGTTTCKNIYGNRCLPDVGGSLGPHIPGIPGHMFIDNGILLFQPEMLLSSSELNVNTQGVIPRTTKPPLDKDGEEEEDVNALPLPPLCWNRIVFTPVARFPSTSAARGHILRNFNYEPILVSEGEHGGIAYDMTMYERLNYYRILMWNQLQPTLQKAWWREQEAMDRKHGFYTKYDVNGWSETSFRIGYQPDLQSGFASGTAGTEEGTADADGTIVGAGDPFAWDLVHGRLSDQTLPWDVDAKEGEEEGMRVGYASAAQMLGCYIVPGPTGEETGTRSARRKNVDRENHADVIDFLKSVSLRKPFDTLEDLPGVFSEEDTDPEGSMNYDTEPEEGSSEAEGKPTQKRKNKGKDSTEAGSSSKTNPKEEKPRDPKGHPRPLRIDNTNLRCFPRESEQPVTHKPSTALSKTLTVQKMRKLGLMTIYDVDGEVATIETTDTLLPKVRYYPHLRGRIQEQYIEIKRKGVKRPILLPVKRTWVEWKGKPVEVPIEKGTGKEGEVHGKEMEEAANDNVVSGGYDEGVGDHEEDKGEKTEKYKIPNPTERKYDPAGLRRRYKTIQTLQAEPTPTVPTAEIDELDEETEEASKGDSDEGENAVEDEAAKESKYNKEEKQKNTKPVNKKGKVPRMVKEMQ
ncbi:uncharacterized protein DFL_000458 [Arthrobotrys flagrans]|uniref:Uncharacterized protein n=1 Tax=Arthrobotrys flagrans TaxID=97331 RepID=A0A437AFB4_ARTFL|nr:hypothetical protein DFL_000458 [Arthrobotrys flagrans]